MINESIVGVWVVWFILFAGAILWLYFKRTKTTPYERTTEPMRSTSQTISTPNVRFSVTVTTPDRDEYNRAWAEAKEIAASEANLLRENFVRPASFEVALQLIEKCLLEIAVSKNIKPPDMSAMWSSCQKGSQKKTELLIRKSGSDAYKLRANAAYRVESLAWAVTHVRFACLYPNPDWKVATPLKRLVSEMKSESSRVAIIGFLYHASDALHVDDPELAALCEEKISWLFTKWQSDEQRKIDNAAWDKSALENFEKDLRKYQSETEPLGRHQCLTGIVSYLDRKRRSDPSVRDKLIEYCEADIALYKPFLIEWYSILNKKVSFKAMVTKPDYECPFLPSFDYLWILYREEKNQVEVERLEQIAKDIKYGELRHLQDRFEDEEVEVGGVYADKTVRTNPIIDSNIDPCQVEIIEVLKSGDKGKAAFLNANGIVCSTEGAVEDHLKRSGYQVQRGELQFWQAMFALAFWEEIFDGTGTPNTFNDIFLDLFSGDQFYLA